MDTIRIHTENAFAQVTMPKMNLKRKTKPNPQGKKVAAAKVFERFFFRFVFRFIHWAYSGSHYCSTSECTTWCRAVRFITPRCNYTILRFWEFKLKKFSWNSPNARFTCIEMYVHDFPIFWPIIRLLSAEMPAHRIFGILKPKVRNASIIFFPFGRKIHIQPSIYWNDNGGRFTCGHTITVHIFQLEHIRSQLITGAGNASN